MRKGITRRNRLKNKMLQRCYIVPITTKTRGWLIKRPKKVLQSHTQNPSILQAKRHANMWTEKAHFSGRASL
jgi:hypothetical protein